jgi:hypothetical protein
MSEMGHASPENDPRPEAIFGLVIGIDEVGASAFFLHYANGAGDTHRNRTLYTVAAVVYG